MIYKTISCDIKNNIAVAILNCPNAMNALHTQMWAKITHSVRESGKIARVIVLTRVGRAFWLGQDLGEGVNPAGIDLERTLKDEYMPMSES